MSTSEPRGPQDIEKKDEGHTTVYNAHVDVSGVDEARLVRKIDWRLLPWLSLLYLLSFLDRTSIGNAKVRHPILLVEIGFDFDVHLSQLYHLTNDLHLSDKEYLLCLTIFYFSYAFFEVCLPAPCWSATNSKNCLTGPEQRVSQETSP